MEDFFSQAWPFAAAILVVLGIIALVLLVIILFRTSKTMKSVQNMAAEAEKEVTPAFAKVNPIVDKIDPIVDKAELLVDTVNLEMLRVDSILEDVEQVSDVAGKAATTVDNVTSGPAEAVNSFVDRIRGSISAKRNDKLKESRVVYPIGAGSDGGEDEVPVSAEQVSAAADEAIREAAQQVADDIAAPAEQPMGKHSVHTAGTVPEAAKDEEPSE